MGLNLLEKTELWVNEITLCRTNLTDLAHAVAQVLQLPDEKILVVDVRPRHITFDVLEQNIPQENIMGKEQEILAALSNVPGVQIYEDTCIHSNGILGLICADTEQQPEMLRRIADMTEEIRRNVARRAIVFPTGFELKQGLIEDTNTPYLRQLLEENGYRVTVGDVIEDSMEDMEGKLSDALSRGFGLVLTTGGVGAEDKDMTVESILRLDTKAAAPYIVKFSQGTGRHVKDGVRIAVGQVGLSTLISLPGPNDEVKAAAPVVLEHLKRGADKETIAAWLAAVLREKWKRSGNSHKHGDGHRSGDKAKKENE